jgi:glycyl-tRNA synthetase beta chain
MGREISGVDEMSDFLLELRSEEIPARMQAGARAELEKLFRGAMARLACGWRLRCGRRRAACADRARPAGGDRGGARRGEGESLGARTGAGGFLRKTGLTKSS